MLSLVENLGLGTRRVLCVRVKLWSFCVELGGWNQKLDVIVVKIDIWSERPHFLC